MEHLYNVGDKVKIRSDLYSSDETMKSFFGCIVTISNVYNNYGNYYYLIVEDNGMHCWNERLIEGFAKNCFFTSLI